MFFFNFKSTEHFFKHSQQRLPDIKPNPPVKLWIVSYFLMFSPCGASRRSRITLPFDRRTVDVLFLFCLDYMLRKIKQKLFLFLMYSCSINYLFVQAPLTG